MDGERLGSAPGLDEERMLEDKVRVRGLDKEDILMCLYIVISLIHACSISFSVGRLLASVG